MISELEQILNYYLDKKDTDIAFYPTGNGPMAVFTKNYEDGASGAVALSLQAIFERPFEDNVGTIELNWSGQEKKRLEEEELFKQENETKERGLHVVKEEQEIL
jgi:hypothetical protein